MGTGIIELDDDATVQTIFDAIKTKTLIENFAIKYGPPIAIQTLSLDQRELSAKSLGIHGETLTIVPKEAKSSLSATDDTTSAPDYQKEARAGRSPENKSGDVIVPWPEREGSLCKCQTSLFRSTHNHILTPFSTPCHAK